MTKSSGNKVVNLFYHHRPLVLQKWNLKVCLMHTVSFSNPSDTTISAGFRAPSFLVHRRLDFVQVCTKENVETKHR